MKMLNVRQSLEKMTQGPIYTKAHTTAKGTPSSISLEKFLHASMDEVRLFWADEYAQALLKLHDIDDAGHFRHGVMRREVGGDVAYDRQRDHSAHTLNNYLLGWYVFEHIGKVREEFFRHLRLRGEGGALDPEGSGARAFSHVWQWASLLHDVGYLFEGGLDVRATGVQDERIRRGVEVVRDYFHHRFWTEIEFRSFAERECLLKLTGVVAPQFADASIGAVADSLRVLPKLGMLQQAVRDELKNLKYPVPSVLKMAGGLTQDCFDLWVKNYEAYGFNEMAIRMRSLEAAFDLLVWRGLPGVGVRVLDHAVCSGLLLLQYSTFYYSLYAGLKKDPGYAFGRIIRKKFRKRGDFDYKPAHWWNLHVWGTAAAAIHNLIQVASGWSAPYPTIPKLVLSHDPVAWLGVLVDILEEWDRSPVRRGYFLLDSGIRPEALPIQGTDVKLGVGRGKLQIVYPNPRIAKKVVDELSGALGDWGNFVEVSFDPHYQSP